MTKKPGVAPYNLLRGQVMELGYVTENGEKVRVRSIPADGLDRMVMNNIMNNIARDLCENADKYDKPDYSKTVQGRKDAESAQKKLAGAKRTPKKDFDYSDKLKEESKELTEDQINLLEQIEDLSEEEFDDFIDSLDEDELAELNDLLESKTASAIYHGTKAKIGRVGHKIANVTGQAVRAPGRAVAASLRAAAASATAKEKKSTEKAFAARHKRAAGIEKAATKSREAWNQSGPVKAKRLAGAAANIIKHSGPAIAAAAAAAKEAGIKAGRARLAHDPADKTRIFQAESYGGLEAQPYYGGEPITPRHHEEDVHSYVTRAAKALYDHHSSHPRNRAAMVSRKECAFHIAHDHLHPGKDLSKPEHAGAAADVLNAAMGPGSSELYEPKYAHVISKKYHQKLRNVD